MKVTKQQMAILTNKEFKATTDKYNPIVTLDVINRFKENGFIVTDLQESRTRDKTKQDKVRHFVRMMIDEHKGVRREVVIMNSSDSTTSLRLHAGVTRLVCNNGLIMCDDLIPAEKIKHTHKSPFSRIDTFINRLNNSLAEEAHIRDVMERKTLVPSEIESFAEQAVALRENDMSKILDPNAVNIIRRPEDAGHSLWNVFNRIQENIVKGDSYRKLSITYDENGEAQEKYRVAKKLTDHTRIIKVNQDLHELAMEYI